MSEQLMASGLFTAIMGPLTLILMWMAFVTWAESRKAKNDLKGNYPSPLNKEVERKLELDEHEMKAFHRF